GYASPALVDFTAGWPRKDGPVLIPGCGNAHEAAALLEQGFANITLLDISPFLTASIRDRFSGTGLQVVTGDFFEHTGSYALILEQTFFCALDPLLRPAYVAHMHQLLHPGGILAGLLFNRDFEGGPPFGGNEDEYRRLFAPYFE
ncbi:MAG TPA: methyltransferase domain-containing protein, partial [Lacibacter sp.]|nr:methyltransferase domain-containing protein [Lacibacter sp.]